MFLYLTYFLKEDIGPDGAPLPMILKELGACEVYPQEVKHSPNGRFSFPALFFLFLEFS